MGGGLWSEWRRLRPEVRDPGLRRRRVPPSGVPRGADPESAPEPEVQVESEAETTPCTSLVPRENGRVGLFPGGFVPPLPSTVDVVIRLGFDAPDGTNGGLVENSPSGSRSLVHGPRRGLTSWSYVDRT